jgi:6-phosphogluconolactonase (cycloisomerase 2 family)
MSRINGLTLQAFSIMACTGLLSSCGGSSEVGGGPAFAYIANEGTLTAYSINSSTGGLTGPVGSPLALPTSPPFGGISQVATDPSGAFLYLLDYSGVYAYSIDRDTGVLTAVAGSPFEAGSIPTSLAFDASGTHLYVAGYSGVVAPVIGTISSYSVNSSGGLVPLAKYTVPGSLDTVVAAGNHLYVAGFYTNSITVFSVGATGELTQSLPGSPVATDNLPFSMVTDPSGSVLYTANYGVPTANVPAPGSISAFTIDSSTGALTPAPGYTQPIAVHGPLCIDPMGRFLFVPETGGVSVYAIDTATGALSAVAGSPFSTGTDPSAVSVDPTDRFVYVVNYGSGTLSEFMLDSTGALSPLAGSPATVVSNPSSMEIVWN